MSKNFKITRENTFYDLIKMVSESNESEINMIFDSNSMIYRNSSNLLILKKIADNLNLDLKFDAANPLHKDYMEAVNNDTIELADNEINLNEIIDEEVPSNNKTKKIGFSVASLMFWKNFRKKDSVGAKVGQTRGKKILFGLLKILGFLAVVVGILFALWWYMPTATVDLTVDSEVLVKLVDVKATTMTNIASAEDRIIPATKIQVAESDSQSIPTTGEKEVGEKATGEITLYNKTDDEITLKKGTIIKLIETDKDSLIYITTEEVDIPERPEDTTPDDSSDEVDYGTKAVKIEALDFGDEYNIGKEEKFEIDDLDTDELVGENRKDIEGGSREVVKIVAQEDITTLQRQVEEFMKQKALDSLRRKTVAGQSLQESSVKFETTSSEFDKVLDEEAENLTLNMTVEVIGLAYSESDLDSIIVELTKTLIPEEYDMDEANPEYEVAATPGATDEEINVQVKIRSYITPKLDTEKIKNDLTGMTLFEAENYLNGINNVKAYVITVVPQLPGTLMRLPHQADKITVNALK